MRIGLFIPCYVDQFYPDVGFAALSLLEEQSVAVDVIAAPVCCGQPLINSGAVESAREMAEAFDDARRRYDAVVSPSASCVTILRSNGERYGLIEGRECEVYELTQFLVQVLGVRHLDRHFEHRVGVVRSCHGLRTLGLGTCSERARDGNDAAFSPAEILLRSLAGLELVDLERVDECCGFGGSFSVVEPDVSTRMGLDRLADLERAGADVITSTDVSCLMHLDGLAKRKRSSVRVLHVSQILAGRSL